MGNVHMEATQINYREGNTKMSVAQAIKNAGSEITPEEKTWIDSIPALTTSNAGKTDQAVIAPEFDSEAGVYAIGNLVMNEGKLYEFTSSHETPGDWDPTEVTEKTVADEVNSVKNGLNNVANRQQTIGYYQYTEDNIYNVWTEHTVTVPELTNIMGVALTPVNSTYTQGFVHEAILISVTGNQFTYAVKGGWSGGLNGVTVSYIVSGT